ncbi:MAG: hypothetical protein AAB666_00390, partial [Patescibacteria group bacterium]
MKRFLMILAAMAFTGCGFDYTPPNKASDTAGDTLAESLDSNDGEVGDEVEFNPPLPIDTNPQATDAEVTSTDNADDAADSDDDVELSETDTGADEIITPVDTADADTTDTPNNDTDSADAHDALDAETVVVPPCVANPLLCADTQPTLDAEIDNGVPTAAEPEADAPDTQDAPDSDTTTTVDAQADILPSADTTVDTQSGEIKPPVDTLVTAEPSADINVAEVAAEIVNNADTATATEISEDTINGPDTFVQPCMVDPTVCDDGNQCTDNDACENSVCAPGQLIVCDDNDACTNADSCNKGVCGGEAIICDDNNPCTDDSCNSQSGCVYTPNNSNPCEDGSLCTIGDFCDAGKCQGGQTLKCDDSNVCTDDVCQPQKGCVYPVNQAGCDDGNGCTIGDICADSACVSGLNICQCAVDTDCAGAEDNILCNGTLMCDKSAMPFKCVVNLDTVITCNTNQDTVCFKNTCVPATGDCEMVAVNQGGVCDDENACTNGDTCSNGSCAGQSIQCDDSNVCTDDSCAPTTGCVFIPNNAECDDNSV